MLRMAMFTMVLIYFGFHETSVYFFQGGTIKFLVNLLDIDKAKDEQRMISEEVNDNVIEHLMAGIEIISGKRGSQYFGVSTFIET